MHELAASPTGRLGVVEFEGGVGPAPSEYRGSLYNVGNGHLYLVSEFTDPVPAGAARFEGINDLTFNDSDALLATYSARSVSGEANEVLVYVPNPVAELLAGQVVCAPEAESETDATLVCPLNGEVDPWGASETEVWFESGATPALGTSSLPQPIANTKSEGEEEALVPLAPFEVSGLRPNQTWYFGLGGRDRNVKAPEALTSEEASFKTPTVAPRIVGVPGASFVKSFSAVVSGGLNPENANTEYFFEYAPEGAGGETLATRCPQGVKKESCEGVASTAALESNEYGEIETTLEVKGLQPATNYRYRLFAINEKGEAALDEHGGHDVKEGVFTTMPAPVPQAVSGAASAIGATTATVAGVVNPDGQPAVYTFELGVDDAGTARYGIVLSASAGSGAVPVEETLPLSGLQPGTTYAYRIAVSSSYGTSYGETMTFTTAGLPAVLVEPVVLPQLPVPAIAFPAETTAGRSTTKKTATNKLTRAQKLDKALKACGQDRSKHKRDRCQARARKHYGPATQAGKHRKG